MSETLKTGFLAMRTYYNMLCLLSSDPPAKKIDDFTVEEFKQLFDINLLAYFISCKVGFFVF